MCTVVLGEASEMGYLRNKVGFEPKSPSAQPGRVIDGDPVELKMIIIIIMESKPYIRER